MIEIEKVKNILKEVINEELKDKCYFVGGCVRDFLMGKNPNDIDIVVNKENGSKLLAFAISKFYKNKVTKPCRLGHYPIWSITFKENIKNLSVKGLTLEISESMKEEFHNVNSRQRYVEFSTLEDDVFRRDFSVNSGLMNVLSGELLNISPTFQEDIKNGIIRCNVGVDKDKIFSDDPLRILRGLVFAIRFNWNIEEDTKEAMIRNGERLKIVAQERKNKELEKVFNIQGGVYKLVLLLNQMDLLKYIFPHINNQKEVYQWNINDKNEFIPDAREIHLEGKTVFDHTLEVLKYTKKGWINAWCSLFHDIGKTNFLRQQLDNNTISFSGHDEAGSKYVKTILNKYYKLDSETIEIVSLVCKYHMRIYSLLDSGDKAKRRFVREMSNKEHRQYLYDLCISDTQGTKKSKNAVYSVIDMKFINSIEEFGKYVEIQKKNNLFNGNELMKIFNVPQGKQVGILINILEDIQDEYGMDITKEYALKLLKDKYEQRNM